MRRELIVTVALLLATVPVWVFSGAGDKAGFGLLPPTITLNLFAGETGVYGLKVHNGNGRTMTAQFSVVISEVPPGGSAAHIGLSYPSSLTVGPGNTLLNVTVAVSQAATPGKYTLLNALIV